MKQTLHIHKYFVFSLQLIVVASCYGLKDNTIKTIQQSGVFEIMTRWRHPVASAQENIELGVVQQQPQLGVEQQQPLGQQPNEVGLM